MASYSFDVVSKVSMPEVVNAVNQASKEISQRYDFKGSKSSIELNEAEIKLISDDEYKLKAVIDILESKMIKRGVTLKSLNYEAVEAASSGTIRQLVKIQEGIEKEKAKEIVKDVKKEKFKVQVQIQGDQLRVSGKNKDDLQDVISYLKSADFGVELQFENYR